MNLSARPAFARTIVAGVVGGSLLTDGAADLANDNHLGWLWLLFGGAALFMLVQHFREQAVRGVNRPDATWSRTDTANVAILAVLVALMLVGLAADTTNKPAEEAATYVVVAVYTILALDFSLQRRQVVRASSRTATSPLQQE